MITNENKEALKDLLIAPMRSTKAMAEMFFPHHVYRPFCSMHDSVFNVIDNDSIRASALACPRGFGKTTLVSLVFPLRKALFQECKYILLISSTFKKAVGDLKTIAAELETNEMIQKVFGSMRGIQWAEGSGELELSSGIKIEAKGAGNQIRGLKYRQYRPDLIIIDDLEDPEGVRNEDRRKILKEWFFADLMNSIDLKRTRVVVVGTVLHEDSLLSNFLHEKEEYEASIASKASHILSGAQASHLTTVTTITQSITQSVDLSLGLKDSVSSEMFHTIRLEAFDDNLQSTWPEYISNEEIKAKFVMYEQRGMLDVLFREYRNLPMSPVGALFELSRMQRYSEQDASIKFSTMETVVIYDPAKSVNPTSDFTAIVGVSMDTINNKIYFRDCVNRRIHPDEAYKEVCDMADRLHTNNIGYEVTGLNEFISFPFENYVRTRGRYYNLIQLKARGSKEGRIKALSPFYKMGAVYHNDNLAIRGALESQLLSFPSSKHDDVMDAFAYSVAMYDIGERFFSGTQGAQGAIEDEYRQLAEEQQSDYEQGQRMISFGCI